MAVGVVVPNPILLADSYITVLAVIVPAAPVPWVYIPLRKPIRLFGWGW
jgi:hypothetical protein